MTVFKASAVCTLILQDTLNDACAPCRVVIGDLVGGITTAAVVEPRWDCILARAAPFVLRKADMASNLSLLEAIRLDILPSHFLCNLDDLLTFQYGNACHCLFHDEVGDQMFRHWISSKRPIPSSLQEK